jgi:putative solute:sodium symporter small subunit
LSIWFVVSYLFGIIMADALDTIHIAGFPLGFWFANQGSEVIFVILILVYVKLMNHLDIKYDVHEQ